MSDQDDPVEKIEKILELIEKYKRERGETKTIQKFEKEFIAWVIYQMIRSDIVGES